MRCSIAFRAKPWRPFPRDSCNRQVPRWKPPHKPAAALQEPQAEASSSMRDQATHDYEHPVNVEDFRRLGYQVVDFICDYYNSLDKVQVRPTVQPGYLRDKLEATVPETAQSPSDVLSEFKDKIMPGVVHWQSPNFFAWYNANSSFPGMLADMLATALNMIGFTWASSPVSTELEMVMMDWLAQLCGLPSKFMFSSNQGGGGVIQGTSSEAVLVAMLAARARALRGRPSSDRLKLVAYASDQVHSCFPKAAKVAGIDHVRVLPAGHASNYALEPQRLEAAIQQDLQQGLLPFFVCATIGTTSSSAVDPIGGLAEVTHRHGCWIHVDAAYAGSAAILPEQRHHFQGLQAVDSYSFNPHKWLLTNFDCCAMWVVDTVPLKEALSLTPVFLQGPNNELDYKDWQIPLGRRFRSLKLLFVLKMYGAEKLRAYVRHHIALAQYLTTSCIAQDPRFELAVPQQFGLVCFRLKGVDNKINEALLKTANERGNIFMSHTVLEGRFTLRCAIGSTSTQLHHVQHAWQVVADTATELLASHPHQ